MNEILDLINSETYFMIDIDGVVLIQSKELLK